MDMRVKGNKNLTVHNVAELIIEAVEEYPTKTITYFTDGQKEEKTYSEIYQEAKNILANMQNNGLNRGDYVVLALEPHSDNIPTLWACVLGGIIPCPITIKVSDEQLWGNLLSHISDVLDDPTFIISSENEKWFNRIKHTLYIETLREKRSNNPEINTKDLSGLAFFMLSSGSTGAPKAIELTHENILSSLEGKQKMTEISNDDVVMNWIAFDHVASLTESHLLPLSVGASQIQVLPSEMVSNPILFLKLISDFHVSHTFTPNFLLGQIVAQLENSRDNKEIESLDLTSLKRIISGGESNVSDTAKKLLTMLEPCGIKKSVIWPAFGMTETCAGSIYSKNFNDEWNQYEFGSLGKPVPGLKIRIVNRSGEEVSNGKDGELQLFGDLVFNKYHANPDATKEAFTEDGWFKTGDVGFIDADTGDLHLNGRRKDSIIVNGVNYFLHDLEAAFSSIEGIEPSYIAAFSTRKKGNDTESLVVFYTPKQDYQSTPQLININNAIRNITILHWGFRPVLVLPVTKAILSKTSLGKIQGSKLRKKYESGQYDELINSFKDKASQFVPKIVKPQNEEEKQVVGLFSLITGIPVEDISVESSFFSLGGTSLETLRLLTGVKRLFGDKSANLQLVDLLKAPTPRKIVNMILEKEQTNYNPIVPLQETGNKTPIFMIHPGVGEVLVFINFANLFINDRPVYALRARGFNPGESYFETFDELVDTYVEAIKKQQPNGPYYISGYSYGGPVSLPVGQKLEAMGDEVHLMIVDAPPVIKHPRGKIDRVESALMLSFFLGFIDQERLDTLGDFLRNSDSDPVEYLYSIAPKNRIKELGQTIESFTKWNDLAFHLAQIGATYEPEGKITDAKVFYTEPIWGDKQEYLDSMLRQWDNYSANEVKYVEIQGKHHTIFNGDNANKFYDIFQEELGNDNERN